ncbi:MAG: hypothetical protein E7328_05805 [Clostridiales bacterium]|nr:hypothetical protein [Clostridiales bacterium]
MDHKTKLNEYITCALFAGFLGLMFLGYLFLPKADFSEKEKRNLQSAPALTVETLTDGTFSKEAESYAADHMPMRDALVSLGAYYRRALGLGGTEEIYTFKGDRLVERPVVYDAAAVKKNMAAIDRFTQKAAGQVDVMLIPSAGYVQKHLAEGNQLTFTDGEQIGKIYESLPDSVAAVDVITPLMAESERSYYRTDHHWTSRGAYLAHKAYLEQKGKEALPQSAYKVETVGGFYGSTYARSGLWLTPPDDLEIWHSGGEFTVWNADSNATVGTLYNRENLSSADPYTVYLDGNHSLVRIKNPKGTGKLLLIRDSFSNCLGTFLADSYAEILLVDLRYYKGGMDSILEEGFDDILIAYSLSNFMTDPNIIYLSY